MPKVSRAPAAASARQSRKHNPISEEYAPTDASFKQKTPKKRRANRTDDNDDNGNAGPSTVQVDSVASRKIMQLGRTLIADEQHERAEYLHSLGISDDEPEKTATLADRLADKDRQGRPADDDDDEWDDEFVVSDDDNDDDGYDASNNVEPADIDAFNSFNPAADHGLDVFGQLNVALAESGSSNRASAKDEAVPERKPGTRNLADIILAKIAEHEAAQAAGEAGASAESAEDNPDVVPPQAVEVYTAVGSILSRQNTGKVPKPFAIIPTLPLGMQPTLLSLTRPEGWTPFITYSATRLFVSKSPTVALQFLNYALLPIVQDRIAEHPQHRLHPTIYRALKKALYKPAAFFKGIVFPMLESGCTMREAHIVASVLARVSIPVLHSAAALMRLTEIAADRPINSWHTKGGTGGGAGPVNHFIKVLIEKKYALPFKVVDALVFHFLRFRGVVDFPDDHQHDDDEDATMNGFGRPATAARLSAEESLPLLWHQSFLGFAQRYRDDITEDQREALLDLLLGKGHRAIGPEIRRELLAGRGRGVGPASAGVAVILNGGDDTMDGLEIVS